MAAPVKLWLLVVLLLVGCAPTTTPPGRVVLVAPFEGRHREIGYQALYAARLALAETERIDLELLAVDDGGRPTTAAARLAALNTDPTVQAALLLGPLPAQAVAVTPLRDDIEVVVVGQWRSELNTFAEDPTPTTCDDICLLQVFRVFADDPTTVAINSSAPPVPPAFAASYQAADQFAPAPLPIAYHTYQVTQALLAGHPLPVSQHRYRYTSDGDLVSVTPAARSSERTTP